MRSWLPSFLLLALPSLVPAQEINKRVGSVTFRVDMRYAHPGGLVLARTQSRLSLGTTFAILEGQRCRLFAAPGGARALIPVPMTAQPGAATLGFEIWGRRGRQRIPVEVTIAPRSYPSASRAIPLEKRPLLSAPDAARDGRRLLQLLRTETVEAAWSGPFQPPVDAVQGSGFGTEYAGGPIESLTDSLHGEHHRGLDYAVPVGTPVLAPAAGTVLLAEHLTVTGDTLVLDHGQGVLSVLYHLSRLDVGAGQSVGARARLALSGDTGIAPEPHLHWGVYVHGVAIDPQVFEALVD